MGELSPIHWLVFLVFAVLLGILFLRRSTAKPDAVKPVVRSDSMPEASQKFCRDCGAGIRASAEICPKCGVRQLAGPQMTLDAKNKLTAGLFALFLGGIGVHKFYLGRTGQGIVYLIFCWTFIPALVGLIEGIVYLTMTDQAFAEKLALGKL